MKRKFEPTRRRRALRNCTVLLALLVLLNLTRGWFCLTPGMARWRAGAEYGFGETRRLWQKWEDWQWGIFFDTPCQLTLAENDGVTVLYYNYPTVVGWSTGCHVLDCTTPGPVWYREFSQYDDGRWRRVVFGRIDDPAAARLELEVSYYAHGRYGDGAGNTIQVLAPEPQVFSVDSSEWLEADGRRYFILRREETPPERGNYNWSDAKVTIYDKAGDVIPQQ